MSVLSMPGRYGASSMRVFVGCGSFSLLSSGSFVASATTVFSAFFSVLLGLSALDALATPESSRQVIKTNMENSCFRTKRGYESKIKK